MIAFRKAAPLRDEEVASLVRNLVVGKLTRLGLLDDAARSTRSRRASSTASAGSRPPPSRG